MRLSMTVEDSSKVTLEVKITRAVSAFLDTHDVLPDVCHVSRIDMPERATKVFGTKVPGKFTLKLMVIARSDLAPNTIWLGREH